MTNEGTSQAIRGVLLRNATLTGASFVQIDTNQSLAELDTSATAVTYTSPQIIKAFGVGSNGSKDIEMLGMGFQIAPGDTLTLAVARVSGGAAFNVNGSLGWLELL